MVETWLTTVRNFWGLILVERRWAGPACTSCVSSAQLARSVTAIPWLPDILGVDHVLFAIISEVLTVAISTH